MENLDDIFLTSLKYFVETSGHSQRKFALEVLNLQPSFLNDLLKQRKYGNELTRRKIASALGFSEGKYEDFLEIGRKILAGQEPGLSAATEQTIAEALPAAHLDGPLLIDVIVILEEFLSEQKKRLPPRAKAEIIVQLYELMKEKEEEGSQGLSKLKLLTPILSRALSLAVDEPLQKTG